MIKNFSDTATAELWFGVATRHLPSHIHARARRTLLMLHAATNIMDLRVPPGNHLEHLVGQRAGQWSIRINKQWRVCFVWEDGNAQNVTIVDYH